jgi:hypothetical protein
MEDSNKPERLKELNKLLSKNLDTGNYKFSKQELKGVLDELEKYPEKERNVVLWQKIVKEKTGAEKVVVTKALDNSDLINIHRQIQDLLDKE